MRNYLIIGIGAAHLGLAQSIARSVSYGNTHVVIESREPAIKPQNEVVQEITLRRKDFIPDMDKYIPENFFRNKNSHPFYRGLKKFKKY